MFSGKTLTATFWRISLRYLEEITMKVIIFKEVAHGCRSLRSWYN